MNRYYLPPQSWSDAILTGDEAHHCAQVMRQKVGDTIEIFDGVGHAATACITSLSKQLISFDWLSKPKLQERAQPIIKVHLCLPKPKAFDWIVFKLVELGVSELQPIISQHCTLSFKASDFAKKEAKWERMLLEACKQCGQNWLPTLKPITHYQQWMGSHANQVSSDSGTSLKIMGALLPEAQPLSQALEIYQAISTVDILIGPEGDLSSAEYKQALSSYWIPCSLGPLVLRVETAIIYAISSIQLTLNPKY